MIQNNIYTETSTIPQPSCVAIGFFDGVHIGHIELIKNMIAYSKEKKLESIILTFDKSPKEVLNQSFDGYLTTQEEKFDILAKTGVDKICYAPFTKEFANISKEDFVKDILINRLNAEAVFAGFNFCFGAQKSGNSETLKKELSNFQKECHILEPIKTSDSSIVSSSIIRNAIKQGNITLANQLLNRHYSFSGKVVHGDHRGTQMGFPTANLLLGDSQKCLPPNGVYACFADCEKESFPAIVNVGYRPTFDKDTYLLEAHLCNFKGDLYNKNLTIRFIKDIRPEIKFPNMDALIAQIDKDKQTLMQLIK